MFLVNNLGSRLKDIVNTVSLRDFFRLKLNRVLSEAKLAVPHLLLLDFLSDFAVLIKHSLALRADDWVTGGHLCSILQAAKLNQENIGVHFLLILGLSFPAQETLGCHTRHFGRWHRLRWLWMMLQLGLIFAAEELTKESTD